MRKKTRPLIPQSGSFRPARIIISLLLPSWLKLNHKPKTPSLVISAEVPFAQLFISGMWHGQKLGIFSHGGIIRTNMGANSTGFSVLPLAGQFRNAVWKQGGRVCILFTVHLHLKTGTYRSLTVKWNNFVAGLNKLCRDKAMTNWGHRNPFLQWLRTCAAVSVRKPPPELINEVTSFLALHFKTLNPLFQGMLW